MSKPKLGIVIGSIRPNRFGGHAAQWIEEYRRFWEGSLDRLAEYLEKTNRRADRKGRA